MVSGSMVNTGIPNYLWGQIAGSHPFTTLESVLSIAVYAIIGSQLVGNVAVILIVEENVTELDDNTEKFGWLMLSWICTVAGNLTLAGSAANIIVAEKASRHHKIPLDVNAMDHFSVMGVLAACTITVGSIVIFAECKMLGYI